MPTTSPSAWRGSGKAHGVGGGSIGRVEACATTVAIVADHSMQERLDDLAKRKEQARHAGSERNVQRQHDRGKMTARERIEYLLDEGSVQELDMHARHREIGRASCRDRGH